MAVYNLLQSSLHVSPPPATRLSIIDSLWQPDLSTEAFDENRRLESFFEYYNEQCRVALHDARTEMLLKSHQDLVDTIQELKDKDANRETIEKRLQSRVSQPDTPDKDELLSDAVNLAARVWLMTSIGGFRNIAGPYQRTLDWKPNQCISDVLHAEFSGEIQVLETVKLERLFTGNNIERIGGIKIKWTSNLADHLLLRDDDTRVLVFHHASFLKAQESNNLFPLGFIRETILTLALLIPEHDSECKRWFKHHKIEHNLDSEARRCGHLGTEDRQIHKFKYWHDRLVILKQAFDEAEPNTLDRWWYDRRKRVQWYTFWVAALVLFLTVLFGLVQCVEGGMQVWKAYHP